MPHAFTTSDRVRLDFAPSCPPAVRSAILDAAYTVAEANGMHVYGHYDKEISGWSIDVTANDRERAVEITDGRVVARLKAIAEERGVSVADMLREAAKGL